MAHPNTDIAELTDVLAKEAYEANLKETHGREWESFANDEELESFKAGMFAGFLHAKSKGWSTEQ
jgi:hypothetical protein